MSRIRTEPTGLPSGGYYALVDGVILRRRQGNRYARVFLSEYRARRAAVALIRERERAEAALQRTPYPAHCLQPLVCAGRGDCLRDPVYID